MPTLARLASGAVKGFGLTAADAMFVFAATITGTTANYNLKSAAIAAGWDQVMKLKATITIGSGVVVGSSSTGSYAFDTGSTFPAGSKLAIINNGYIVGRGGDGGYYSYLESGKSGSYSQSPGPGSNGGPALIARFPVTIENNGVIGGGGGGGGGGSYYGAPNSYGGAGGGGAGYYAGSGGTGGGGGFYWGSGGGTTSGGSGGAGGGYGGSGGSGGGLGAAGATGATVQVFGASGGSGGSAVAGNSNITWAATGSRYGAITS